MASNPNYCDITPEIEALAAQSLQNSSIDAGDYVRYDVKRGLRDLNGKGVLAGLTEISDIIAKKMVDGQEIPCDGKLYYRGIDVEKLVAGALKEGRFGFEETAYLLLLGRLPNAAELESFKNQLAYYRTLPGNFVRDVILKAPSQDIMNSLARSVLNLASYDERCDDISLPNVMRQCLQLIALFPVLSVYGYQAYTYKSGNSLYIHAPQPELSTAENILSLLRPDSSYSFWEAHVLDICQKADLVFLGLHGMDGEDGRIQAALDLLGVPYTGAGHLASAVAMDKAVSKQILDACGIPTPKWRLLSYGLDEAEPLAQTLPMPCVIKTIGGGSSLGVYLPEDRTELKRALEEVLRYGAKVLAEERIYGRELTVAVLGDRWLPAVETVPAGKEFDYVAKYQAGAAVETCPADVPPAVMQAAGELALRTHRALGLEVYSRTDMILDKDGNLWVLEANSLPGMTPNSFVPKEAAAVGMSYNQLCEEIVRLSCDVKRRG